MERHYTTLLLWLLGERADGSSHGQPLIAADDAIIDRILPFTSHSSHYVRVHRFLLCACCSVTMEKLDSSITASKAKLATVEGRVQVRHESCSVYVG